MNWVTIIWSVAAGACLTLGVMHLLIWLKNWTTCAHLALAFAALAGAGVAAGEMQMMAAGTPADFVRMGRWIHVPIMALAAGIVCFVGCYFRTGRPWLGWAAVGIRFVSLVLNFFIPSNLNYREVTALRKIDFLGQPVSVVAEGIANPWNLVAHLSSLLMVVFVVDASLRSWRTGGRDARRRALVVGGSIISFVILAAGHSALIHAKVVQSPYLITFCFLGVIIAMAHELSHDVISAARLSHKLRESQQQTDLAAAAARLALWTLDIPKDLFWVNPQGRSMYGFARDEPISVERSLATVHPEDVESVRNAVTRSLTPGGDFAADYRVVLPDGSTRWITALGKVEFDGKGNPRRVSGVSVDNTERRQAEDRSRLVVEATPNAMIMVDSSANMVLVNTQAESLFGYSREEMLGQPIEMLIPGRFSSEHPALHKNFFANSSARAMGTGRELFGLRKDGTEVPVEVGLNPIHTTEGNFVLSSVIDITERRRAEKEALDQRDELFHLSRVASLGQLSGSLAHELNQPLGIILSNAQAAQRMLAVDNPDIQELREILADIISEDRRAGEVITRLRALLKRGETKLLPLALHEVINDVVRLLRSDLTAHGVTVQTMFADALPLVSGDEVQLQQVLLNIINNACDAMDQNPPQERALKISTSLKPGKACLAIEDQGCGLPDGDATRIFQPFVTTKNKGLGIGLSICRSIIVAHHGQIWAGPNAGRGTTIYLELPMIDPPAL